MTLNILRTAAGCASLDELAERIESFSVLFEKQKCGRFTTRNTPKRAQEILNGQGSVYWIIKNRIQARSQILAILGTQGVCTVVFHPDLIQTVAVSQRAVQGWRYLDRAKTPRDRGLYMPGTDDSCDSALSEDLKASGLL